MTFSRLPSNSGTGATRVSHEEGWNVQFGCYLWESDLVIELLLEDGQETSVAHHLYSFFRDKNLPVCLASAQLAALEFKSKGMGDTCLAAWQSFKQYVCVVKTPGHIDWEHPLAKHDLENYLVDLAAEVIDAKILTTKKELSALSDRFMLVEQFHDYIKLPHGTMIPFLDLKSPHLNLVNRLDSVFDRVLRSGQYILGNEVSSFEKEFADYCETNHCVGVGNGLEALHLILRAYGIGVGD